MPLAAGAVEELARRLLAAQAGRQPVPPLAREVTLTADDAYTVQEALIRQKLQQGDRLVGWKLGLTSQSKQQQMGVYEPIYGTLLASHLLPAAALPLDRCIHPKVEPEIAVILGDDLAGPGVTEAAALRAIRWIVPALDVIDSRYENFQFTLTDVIADNASTCLAVTGGRPVRPEGIDLRLLGAVLEKNGEVVATATGAAVLGNPLTALAWLANALAARGGRLRAGQVVLTGALTGAVPVQAGDLITATFDRLGTVSLRGVRG